MQRTRFTLARVLRVAYALSSTIAVLVVFPGTALSAGGGESYLRFNKPGVPTAPGDGYTQSQFENDVQNSMVARASTNRIGLTETTRSGKKTYQLAGFYGLIMHHPSTYTQAHCYNRDNHSVRIQQCHAAWFGRGSSKTPGLCLTIPSLEGMVQDQVDSDANMVLAVDPTGLVDTQSTPATSGPPQAEVDPGAQQEEVPGGGYCTASTTPPAAPPAGGVSIARRSLTDGTGCLYVRYSVDVMAGGCGSALRFDPTAEVMTVKLMDGRTDVFGIAPAGAARVSIGNRRGALRNGVFVFRGVRSRDLRRPVRVSLAGGGIERLTIPRVR